MIALTERAERRRADSTRSTRCETIESYPSIGLEDFKGSIRSVGTGSLSVMKISVITFYDFEFANKRINWAVRTLRRKHCTLPSQGAMARVPSHGFLEQRRTLTIPNKPLAGSLFAACEDGPTQSSS